jgi:quinol monooxygenase YgiN
MIVRIFRARVLPGKHDQWQQQVEDHSITWLASQEGMLGYFPGKPHGDERDFVMVSLWQDIAALEKAVGENWSQAILFEDEASLVEEVSIEHYESFGMPDSSISA